MFSFLGNYNYYLPKPIPLTKTMKDYLEDEVDEKYYINSEKAKKLIDTLIQNGTLDRQTDRQTDVALTEQSTIPGSEKLETVSQQDTITELATCVQREIWLSKVNEVGYMDNGTGQHQSNTVYSSNGVSPCLNSTNYKEPVKVVEYERNKNNWSNG